MSTLEYAIHGLKRAWSFSGMFVVTATYGAAVLWGFFDPTHAPGYNLPIIFAFIVWGVVFCRKLYQGFARHRAGRKASARHELETGLLLVVAVYAVIQNLGGGSSPFYPLIFIMVAFVVAYFRSWVGYTLVAATLAMEILPSMMAAQSQLSRQIWFHSAFILSFAILNTVFTKAEVIRMRLKAMAQLENAKNAVVNDARDFRLASVANHTAACQDRDVEETKRSTCSVDAVRRTMFHHVDLLKRTMDLHTCVLFWLEESGDRLRMLECVSDSESVTQRKIERREGAIGAVLLNGRPLCLKKIQPGFPGIPEIPYYDGKTKVTDFMGVPITDGDTVCGVLCADRLGDRPFGEVDEENLQAAVDSIVQIISNERIFSQLQRVKSEQSKLLNASEALTRALTEPDVLKAALTAAARIATYDIAAIALTQDPQAPQVQIVRLTAGRGASVLEGVSFGPNGSMASSVMKNKHHYLPYEGKFNASQQIIYNKQTQRAFSRMQSALVLPLCSGDDVLGTLTLAAAQPDAYPETIRTTLQVMTHQLGTALQNAQMVRRLEEMATTDGLTGLANHRVFQEELSRQMAQSNRFQNQTSIILGDVDKFKSVNDTYGHPVGDVVLQGVGDVLRGNVVRDTDLPARYGGEEFAVVCAGTDTKGAVKLAEKIRKNLENRVFQTEKGELRVTISMGVATYPSHALNKEDLVERADTALYFAKENGRNQVRVWSKGMQKIKS